MRVCMVTGSFPKMKCGVGDYTYHLTSHLADLGVKIEVVTWDRPCIVPQDDLSYNIRLHPLVKNWSLWEAPKILNLLKKISPDIVHFQYPSEFGIGNKRVLGNLLSLLAHMINPRPAIITTMHEFGQHRLRWRARASVNIAFSDYVICTSELDRKAVSRLFNLQDRSIFIPIGSNIKAGGVVDKGRRNAIRARLGVTENETLLVHFGLINQYKAFEAVLFALQNLVKTDDQVKLLVIGEISDTDPYHIRVRRLAHRLGVSDYLVGGKYYPEQEVSDLLYSSDIAVIHFPKGVSLHSGSFMAVASHGLPVVTTQGELVPRGLLDHRNVILVPPNSPEEMADALRELIDNYLLRRTIGQRAEEFARSFSWDDIALRTKRLYEQVTGHN